MPSKKSQALANNVSKLTNLFIDIFTDRKSPAMSDAKKIEASQLMQQIIEELIWSPGSLIYIKDQVALKQSKTVIDFIWETLDTDEIFNDITGGGCSGLLVNIIGDYIDRAKLMKPTFISVNPAHTEFQVYFQEAMKAWIFGLNNSALILCCAIFESLIAEKLYQTDKALVYYTSKNNGSDIKKYKLEMLIKNAYKSKLMNKADKESAMKLKELRNSSVHNLESVSDKQVYDVLINTKEIIEKLLKK